MTKEVVRVKLVRHKWPDEIEAEKRKRRNRYMIISICILFFAGGFLTSSLWNKTSAYGSNNDQMKKLMQIYNVMNNQFYFGEGKENLSDTLLEGAINGLVNAGGDQHTMYLNKSQTESFTSSMEGSFVGIGVQYYELAKGIYMIDRVYKDSGAEEAGIMQGDQLFAIDGKQVKDMDIEEVAKQIKGSSKSKVTIEVLRENKHKKMEVERREVASSVFSEIKGDIGILELSTFAETSGDEVGKHLKNMKDKNCKNLILDFRKNGGGYLIAAQQIASYLLPKDTVIFQEKSKDGSLKDYKTLADYEQYTFDKMVVLVDGETASATEVLTAALKEQMHATIVGQNTYGKGTVQVPVPFKDGSMLKYTTAEWLTSKGESINGKGYPVDIEVALDAAVTTAAPKLEEDEVYKADTVNIAAKSVQTYLKFLGYGVDREDPYFSTASSNALKQYQRDKGLKVTGTIDAEGISSLLSSCALKWHQEEDALDLQMKKALEIVNGK